MKCWPRSIAVQRGSRKIGGAPDGFSVGRPLRHQPAGDSACLIIDAGAAYTAVLGNFYLSDLPRHGSPPGKAGCAAIILVHGTGAAARDQQNPHWWQPTSEFARNLLKTVKAPVRIIK